MSVLRVAEPFACTVDGVPKVYRAGDLVHASDPVVKGREGLFVEVEVFADRAAKATATPVRAVETATAAPGEQRHVTPPAKKSAAKKK